MSFSAIVEMLRVRIGLDLATVGESAGHEAIRARMSETRSPSIERYHQTLVEQPAEIDALIEEIVVSETWFFREASAYVLLTERARRRAPTASDPFRVLCVPCATGEEAYSVVLTLIDAGLRAAAVEVQAVDVSRRALAEAERATYGEKSFRGSAQVSPRHFDRVDGKRRVNAEARARVSFVQGNVLDPQLCAGSRFDAVFCRNLLIYLDRPARATSFDNFRRWLRPEGILFVGHAEAAIAIDNGMTRAAEAASLAFEVAKAPAAAVLRAALPRRGRVPDRPSREPRKSAVKPPRPASPKAQDKSEASTLDELRALADRGELKVAHARCSALADAQPSAAVYCLLGIICQALGDLDAARNGFDRALYLDPRHYESLVHAAFVHERAGRAELATTLRRRAERCRAGGGAS
jgi:chemotaxis protein methyltransferase WspC